ncbi:MAG: hypothetical protein GY757_10440, partial [bacterium]|nr:hypothetical protein [bacterium]
MEQLTNPDSRYFVPHPYPKTKKEILTNLTYYFKKRRLAPPHIGDIFKIKNRVTNYSEDYLWFILVKDSKGTVIMTVEMRANGRLGIKKYDCHREMIKTKKEVLRTLSQALKKTITEKDIKYAELMTYLGTIDFPTNPIWEIELPEGKRYYCGSDTGYV